MSETFVSRMLGMEFPEDERMMKEALARREPGNTEAPPVWTGAKAGTSSPKTAASVAYMPEGF